MDDLDIAWEKFQKAEEPFTPFKKASIEGKLDTIAAQIQEISADSKRVADIIPKIMGDESALQADEEDPLDIVLGGETDISSMMPQGMGDMGGASADTGAAPEGGASAEGGEAPEEGEAPAEEEEDTVEKAEDKEDPDISEMEDEVSDIPDGSTPEEVSESVEVDDTPDGMTEDVAVEETAGPAAEEMPEEMPSEMPDAGGEPAPPEDNMSEGDAVENIEPAGQEGLPPEGVPDLTDEINATQPEGLINIYGRFVEAMQKAAELASEVGTMADVSDLAGAQNAIDGVWRNQIAPLMDALNGTDDFTKSLDDTIRKSESMNIMKEKSEDDIESSHEVAVSSHSEEGSENTTGKNNGSTDAPTIDGRVEGTDAPHALNNDTTTEGSCDPPSFEKSVPAEPPSNGEGMTPVEKSLKDFEGYSEDYADPDPDLPYEDAIRKSIPSFRDIMKMPEDERFYKAAEMRHGPHKTFNEFMKSWYGLGGSEGVEKSMTEGQPMAGSDGFEACSGGSMEKSDGAMTAGTEGAVNPMYGETTEKSMAGQPGPSMSMEKSDDMVDDVNAAFEKSKDTSTGTTSVDEELKGPACDKSADTGTADVESSMKKSMENGKPIPNMRDMVSFRKSHFGASIRPSAIASVNGDITRPEEDSFRKAATAPPVRMGQHVDPRKVTEGDWQDYYAYKAQRRFN